MERQKIKVTCFAASIFTYRVRSHLEAACMCVLTEGAQGTVRSQARGLPESGVCEKATVNLRPEKLGGRGGRTKQKESEGLLVVRCLISSFQNLIAREERRPHDLGCGRVVPAG